MMDKNNEPIFVLQNALTVQEQRRLQEIYVPTVVAIPPSNAWMDMCMMPDGEIRYYGECKDRRVYISSKDGGISWKEYDVKDKRHMCAGLRNPYTQRWIASYFVEGENGYQGAQMPTPPPDSRGWQAVLSDEGPGGVVKWVQITNLNIRCPPYPWALSRKNRILICAQLYEKPMRPIVARSDDNGETWKVACLKGVEAHEITEPHQGYRWQNGACEPTIVERDNGNLLMLVRTSQDYHYQYESFDGGETWTDPVASSFHGTLTMPTMLKLSTGEILSFWCNTQPLPELDKRKIWPPLNDGEISGLGGEDVFTNRDVNHAALSFDDGVTWKGFREIFLNPIRNASDFRTRGGNEGGLDKSVHQFQALELPYAKVLLACGQHVHSRRLIIFDPKWLLETERREDFKEGLLNVSTQVYLKSVSGNCRTYSGHCSWNRTNGAVLMADPDGNYEEALYLRANPDPLLFNQTQGVVWNFPAIRSGQIDITLQVMEEGVTVMLTDRWFNPCDITVDTFAAYSYKVDGTAVSCGKWYTLTLRWDEKECQVLVEGRPLISLKAAQGFGNGLCYLVVQSPEKTGGGLGTYIKKIEMQGSEKPMIGDKT